jgi:pilus assembly protein CpaF
MKMDQDLKRMVRVEAGMRFGSKSPSAAEVRELARQILDAKLKERRLQWDAAVRDALLAAVTDDLLGFGPLEPLFRDDRITEIMINGPHRVYIEREGRKAESGVEFEDEGHLRSVLDKMLGLAGRRLDQSSPYVDFSLKDGSRINAIIAPLAADGTSVTIRKFLPTLRSCDDLVRLGTISEPMSRFLQAAVKAKLNILFAGATGAGKTATLNVLSGGIAADERIVTIEDALELNLNQDHVVRLLTRANNIEGKGAISVRQLFSNTLRMRPTRIILGEIRGEEAIDFLQAVNSGHDGTLAVLHASTPADVIGRLETMAMYAGLPLPSSELRRQIASGVDLIVMHEQMADGSRKITYVTEVAGMSGGEVALNDIFRFEVADSPAGAPVAGEFRLVNRPARLSRFRNRGVRLDGIF